MILETVKTFLSSISSLEKKERNIVSVSTPLDLSIVKRQIQNGKWAILNYDASPTKLATYGLRVIPNLDGINWPVVSTMPYMESTTNYPSMAGRIIGGKLRVVNEFRESCEKYKDDWKKMEEILIPFYQMFGGKDSLQPLKEFIFDESRWPSDEIEESELVARRKQIYLSLDTSQENKFLFDLIETLNFNNEFLPEIPTVSCGIYEDRIKSMIAMRAYRVSQVFSFSDIEALLLLSCQYIHGFDTEDINPRIQPPSNDTCLHIFDPISFLCADFNSSKLSENIKSQPEFHIAEAMNEMGESYNGVEHLEVAAYYDENGEPLKAWNNLVSAGYWAGKNLPDAQPEILNAAIQLCQRQGWLEAEEVLKYNKDIMESA